VALAEWKRNALRERQRTGMSPTTSVPKRGDLPFTPGSYFGLVESQSQVHSHDALQSQSQSQSEAHLSVKPPVGGVGDDDGEPVYIYPISPDSP